MDLHFPDRCPPDRPPLCLLAPLVACGHHACLVMEEAAGHSHYGLWAAAHPQLAGVRSMAAVFPLHRELRARESGRVQCVLCALSASAGFRPLLTPPWQGACLLCLLMNTESMAKQLVEKSQFPLQDTLGWALYRS